MNTTIVEGVDMEDGDILDVSFTADVYEEEDGEYFFSEPKLELFGDITFEEVLYSEDEIRQIKKYLEENVHMIEHRLKKEFERWKD